MSGRRPNQRVGRFDQLPADEAKALLEAMDSMSAPRKIWAYDDGLNSPDSRSWSATVPVGPAYHHDDVVRELVEALEPFEAMAALYDPDDGDSDQQAWAYGARPTIGQLRHARAALAKIAQEG